MALFTSDTFTLGTGESAGESLSAHTGEVGAAWTALQSGFGDIAVAAAGRARLGGTTTSSFWYAQYESSGVPADADYSVRADLSFQSVPTAPFSALVQGRTQNADTYYSFGYDSTQGWTLRRTSTLLGSAAHTPTAGSSHTIALVMSGSAISGVVDGTTVVGPITDAAISAAGRAGLQIFVNTGTDLVPGDAIGPQFDNFAGDDSAGVTVSVSPASVTLDPGASQQFGATVTNSSNQNVTWSVQEGAPGGTISSGGLYTAPTELGTYHVVATAAADGVSTGEAAVVVYAPTPPGPPQATLATASGFDTITLPAPSTLGTNAIAGYRLYAGTASGQETFTGLTITPGSFPASFPPQASAPAGAARYYYVRAADEAGLLSAPSQECWSRSTRLVPSGTSAPRVFVAPYGSAAAGLASTLGYTVYDDEGAVLVPHTVGQTFEIGAGGGQGTGIYAALVTLDSAYEGVLVWDAPSGSGPYVEAFDSGPLAQVAGYLGGLDPASQVLADPQHKLLTNAAGQVDLDWTQAIPATASGLTLGRAALAAIAEGVGVWKYDPAGKSLREYAEDGTTLLRSFALTIDTSGTITERD